MEQYISKAALMAEIENIEADAICQYQSDKSRYAEGSLDVIHRIKHLLDALEVKEVDIDKEIDIEDAVHGTVDYPFIGHDFPNIYPNYKELKKYCDRKGIKDNDKVKLIIIKDM